MTRKRTRPFTVEYDGQYRVFPPDATAKDIAQWKKSVREWLNVPSEQRVALNAMLRKAEERAWKQDHPRRAYPEHECGLTQREYAALQHWRERYEQTPGYRRLLCKYQAAIAAAQGGDFAARRAGGAS